MFLIATPHGDYIVQGVDLALSGEQIPAQPLRIEEKYEAVYI
jgi:hypothetical protein